MVVENFFQWIKLKIKLHNLAYEPPLVAERDLWWVCFGENVGSEINGKSSLFSRPGLIIKKLSNRFYLVAPTTSKERQGTWYTEIHQGGKSVYVCLHQVRTIDYRRLSTRLGVVDEEDFEKVKNGFWDLYK